MSGPRAGTLVSTGEELLLSDRTSGQVRRLILLLSGDIEENPGPDKFQEEKLVIITSTKPIKVTEWRRYLVQHFERLTRQDSRIYVLGGIHGYENGKIGLSVLPILNLK